MIERSFHFYNLSVKVNFPTFQMKSFPLLLTIKSRFNVFRLYISTLMTFEQTTTSSSAISTFKWTGLRINPTSDGQFSIHKFIWVSDKRQTLQLKFITQLLCILPTDILTSMKPNGTNYTEKWDILVNRSSFVFMPCLVKKHDLFRYHPASS